MSCRCLGLGVATPLVHTDYCQHVFRFLCIKSVVFLTFWQASALAVLSSFDVIKATKYMTAEDVLVGLNAILTSFEMVV